MSILGGMDSRGFLREYWQQRPLLVRGAVADAAALVDGDDLAGLACEDDVESRIVIHDPSGDGWLCEHGPFQEQRFAALPERNWSLLVQGVEHWVTGVDELFGLFDFLPRWRLDDIMASYATDGGGVGPHFDYYDVFLIQARGRRRWRLGQSCGDATALRDHPALKLLAEFQESACHELAAGDMLYLPPGLAHWGNALGDDCITLSVGFRAPSHRDLLQGMAARLAEDFGEQQRYRDRPESVDADPFLINAVALEQLKAVFEALDDTAVERALADSFGRQLTEPRQPELMQAPEAIPILPPAHSLGRAPLRLRHHPASRFAYTVIGPQAWLFVDGDSHLTVPALARGLCHGQVDPGDLDSDPARALLSQLLAQGSVALQ